jgi:hypothetical protein
VYVGYSPIVGVDADKIAADLPGAHVLSVVRNPWSAYADHKRRPVPLSLAHYVTVWNVHLLQARTFAAKLPGRVHIVRYEDVIEDPVAVLTDVLAKVGVGGSPTLARPSWNGSVLESVVPWGTIRTPTREANEAEREQLGAEEREEIRLRTGPLLGSLGYA